MNEILKTITKALGGFDKSIPGLQGLLYKEMLSEIKRLDTNGDSIKVTVKNLSILASIKSKLNRIILSPEYKAEIKAFAAAFNSVYKLQFEYWKSIEKTFKPKPLLKAIRNQAITDVVGQLTTSGISANVSDAITNILRTNITAGGSYKDLAEQLRQSLTNTPESKGILDRYVKTVATDSINQFNRQFSNIVAADLGYEWYLYANTEIKTSRPFCQSMVENHTKFHISQVQEMLQGKWLGQKMKYIDNIDGTSKTVEIYAKTGLPMGLKDGTNVDNFFILAGGFNCMHSINPISKKQVPQNIQDAVYATAAYKAWAELNGKEIEGESKATVKGGENLTDNQKASLVKHAQSEMAKFGIKEDIKINIISGKNPLAGSVVLKANPEKITSITISENSKQNLNSVISHELTHVGQINNNKLFIKGKDIIYDGKKVMSTTQYKKQFPFNKQWTKEQHQAYENLPWEKRAYGSE